MDVKAISDLAPLVVHRHIGFFNDSHTPAVNIMPFRLPPDFDYYVQAYINYRVKRKRVTDNGILQDTEVYTPEDFNFEDYDQDYFVHRQDVYGDDDTNNLYQDDTQEQPTPGLPYDGKYARLMPIKLVPHYVAEKFFTTAYNMPWVKIPVCYIEQNIVYVVYDMLNKPLVKDGSCVHLTYIKKPNTFVKDLSLYDGVSGASFFDCPNDASDSVKQSYEFECNSTVAEELVSLAVAFALENVESQRLNSKLNMRGLEA